MNSHQESFEKTKAEIQNILENAKPDDQFIVARIAKANDERGPHEEAKILIHCNRDGVLKIVSNIVAETGMPIELIRLYSMLEKREQGSRTVERL